MGKIFAHATTAATSTAAAASAPPVAAGGVPAAPAAPVATTTASPVADAPVAAGAPAAASPSVDVASVMDQLAAKNSEHLDWKTSIVDMLKLVGMDSSLAARKELAHDLAYSGDTDDSAAMNEWLHKEVLAKLAENGGKVPAELLAKAG